MVNNFQLKLWLNSLVCDITLGDLPTYTKPLRIHKLANTSDALMMCISNSGILVMFIALYAAH